MIALVKTIDFGYDFARISLFGLLEIHAAVIVKDCINGRSCKIIPVCIPNQSLFCKIQILCHNIALSG